MILDIDVSRLKNGFNSINQDFTNFNQNLNSGFDELKNIKQFWNDKNTDFFIEKVSKDEEKIKNYNDKTKQVIESIVNFINSLSSISSSCGINDLSHIRFNSDSANVTSGYCSSSSGKLKRVRGSVNYSSVPSSCRYRHQIDNWSINLEQIANEVSSFGNDINDKSMKIVNSVNELKNGPASRIEEPLNIKELSYRWFIGTPASNDYSDTVNSSLEKQNLSSSSVESSDVVKNNYSNFNNSSIYQNATSNDTEVETSEIGFVNTSISQNVSDSDTEIETLKMDPVNNTFAQTTSDNTDTIEEKIMYSNGLSSIDVNDNKGNINVNNNAKVTIKGDSLNANNSNVGFSKDSNSNIQIKSKSLDVSNPTVNIKNNSNNSVNVNVESLDAKNNVIDVSLSSPSIDLNVKNMDVTSNQSDVSVNSFGMDLKSKSLTPDEIVNNNL